MRRVPMALGRRGPVSMSATDPVGSADASAADVCAPGAAAVPEPVPLRTAAGAAVSSQPPVALGLFSAVEYCGPAARQAAAAANSRSAAAPRLDASSAERFWAKVSPADDEGHQWWLGAIDRNRQGPSARPGRGGYGRFSSGRAADGGAVVASAHRYAWLLEYGPIPEGFVVRHVCDEPICLAHLELGTVADNNSDTSRRGRAAGARRAQQLDSRGAAGRSMAIRAAVRAVLVAGAADAVSIGGAARAAMRAGELWRHDLTLWDSQ